MTTTPAPLPGQEHLPWLLPRPGVATPLPTVRDLAADSWHAYAGCGSLRAGQDGENLDTRPVPVERIGAMCGCLRRADVHTLLPALATADRRVGLVGLPPGRRWRSTDPLVRAVLHAGVAADGDGEALVAALPLPVARWARDVALLELVRIRTIDAHAIVPTAAGLWCPGQPDDVHAELEQAVRTARRLASTG